MTQMSGPGAGGLGKPSRAVSAVMAVLFGIWLMFSVGVNWAGASPEIFTLLCGSTALILEGQIWRLFTAPLLHDPGGIGHIFSVLLGLYFLTPSLEAQWGPKKLLQFLTGSALFAYLCQLVLVLLLPASVGHKLVGAYWFGAIPMLEAIAIAFALNFKGQTVRLMFVLPVSSNGLVYFVIGISVLMVITTSVTPAGLLAPFGGIAAGFLFGAPSPSPLRRLALRLMKSRLEKESSRLQADRTARVARSGLSVIKGGRDDVENDRGPDGRWMN